MTPKTVVGVSNAVPDVSIRVRAMHEIVMHQLEKFFLTSKGEMDLTRIVCILK